MKSRPTLFLSGVSSEFGPFRDAVENEIEMKGCFAENQPGFPPDYRSVEEMLRRKLSVGKESGTKAEFEKLMKNVKGNSLTLTLLGGFLKRAIRSLSAIEVIPHF